MDAETFYKKYQLLRSAIDTRSEYDDLKDVIESPYAYHELLSMYKNSSRDSSKRHQYLQIAEEELGELQQVLFRVTRRKDDWFHLLEEMADVHLIMKRLQEMYDVTDTDIALAAFIKLDRYYKKYGYEKLEEKEEVVPEEPTPSTTPKFTLTAKKIKPLR